MSEIVNIGGETKLDIPAERVLTGALNAQVDPVLVLGYDADGELYAASSTGDQAQVVHLMELFKHRLLAGEYK